MPATRTHVPPRQPADHRPAVTVRDLTLEEQAELCPGCRLGRCDWGALHESAVQSEIEFRGYTLPMLTYWRWEIGTPLSQCDCCGEKHPRELFTYAFAEDGAHSDTAACRRCSS